MTPPTHVAAPQIARAIENGFPAALVSTIAEHESWRKEIYRPLSYIHKWWARRLGSVFRAMIVAGCADGHQDVADLLWTPLAFPDMVVYDPFMGSGVTVHEALKLGCRVIGRDINPVSYAMVRAAIQPYDRADVIAAYEQLAQTVAPQITSLYACTLPDATPAEGLYYFWVKMIACPLCAQQIDLFKSRIFAKHAYPKQHPASQSLCPTCDAINVVDHDATRAICHQCATPYNPQQGVFERSHVRCPHCHATFTLIDAVRRVGSPPAQRLYAKMALDPAGDKHFLPISADDRARYAQASAQLSALWQSIPQQPIAPGYNTDQVLHYGYQSWHQMFNARQLVALATLTRGIAALPNPHVRPLMACLFSGALEFNNMFASFKGIGTGAVRHMFAHHILKPELTPLEANLWGTERSSGSFSTLFEHRILRALDYKDRPFELRMDLTQRKATHEKVFDLSPALNAVPATDYAAFARGAQVYLSAGDSAATDIASASVDLVVTDPPFFDNVHYSQLADFFYVWLRQLLPDDPAFASATTRSPQEVQQTDARLFAERLGGVLAECHRVLKPEGLLIFTYHHTRAEGWAALYQAIRTAGFVVTKTHPVKAEMAVSVPVQQAKVPVSYDLIIVCRKDTGDLSDPLAASDLLQMAADEARTVVAALSLGGLSLTPGDIKVALMGCILVRLSTIPGITSAMALLEQYEPQIDALAQRLA